MVSVTEEEQHVVGGSLRLAWIGQVAADLLERSEKRGNEPRLHALGALEPFVCIFKYSSRNE